MADLNCTDFIDPKLNLLCNHFQEAQAAAKTSADNFNADLQNFFLLWASSLVLFMHAGFAMLSAGAVRSKNTKNILISIVMDLTVCAIAWYLCGFAFAFGEDRGGFIGASYFVGLGVGASAAGSFDAFFFWFFEFCFAATAATIVSGAIAERARFETYLLTSTFISFWIYPVVVHWVWGKGFLTLGYPTSLMGSGVADFAGCGPVHMIGGVAGMWASKIMGPRIGRFDLETGEPLPMPGHSSPLATLGVFILWIGWLGFNPGSIVFLTGGNGVYASRAAINTILSSSGGALSAMFTGFFLGPRNERDYDLGIALNGALAGLVSVTGCCPWIELWAAICIGLLGGILYVWASRFTLYTLKIDDPLDATPVHLFCGVWGIVAGAFFVNPVLLVPFFAPSSDVVGIQVPSGVFYGGNTFVTKFPNGTTILGGSTKGALVGNAVVEIVCIFTWVTVFTVPFFYFFQRMNYLRVPADVEEVGLDASHHGGTAYPDLFHKHIMDTPTKNALKAKQEEIPPKVSLDKKENPETDLELQQAAPVTTTTTTVEVPNNLQIEKS